MAFSAVSRQFLLCRFYNGFSYAGFITVSCMPVFITVSLGRFLYRFLVCRFYNGLWYAGFNNCFLYASFLYAGFIAVSRIPVTYMPVFIPVSLWKLHGSEMLWKWCRQRADLKFNHHKKFTVHSNSSLRKLVPRDTDFKMTKEGRLGFCRAVRNSLPIHNWALKTDLQLWNLMVDPHCLRTDK